MDRLLEAFGDYVASSRDMDVAYSDKTGYVRLITAEYADTVFFEIDSFDAMLNMFYFDILEDAVEALLDANRERNNREVDNRDMDYDAVYRKLRAYVCRLDADRDYALRKLDRFIARYRAQLTLP